MKSGCHNRQPAAPGYWANDRIYNGTDFINCKVWIKNRMSTMCRTRDRDQLAECQGCEAPLDPEAPAFRGTYAAISINQPVTFSESEEGRSGKTSAG